MHNPADMHAGGTLRMWAQQKESRGESTRRGGGPPASRPGKPTKPGKPSRPPRKRWVTIVKWAAIASLVGLAIVSMTVALTFWMYGRDPKLPQITKLSD